MFFYTLTEILINYTVLKFGQFPVPETCENWLGLVNSCVYHACQTHEIYEILPYWVDFKAPAELWNPLNKAALSKCINKWPLNIWNDGNAQK